MEFKKKLLEGCKKLNTDQLKELLDYIMFIKVKKKLRFDEFGNIIMKVA